MLSLSLATIGVASVLADVRNFQPKAPDMEFHEERVWLWLNPKCFPAESDVLAFKDHLVSEYDCVHFNRERKTIYQHPTQNGYVWSLWLELSRHCAHSVDCLSANISLPQGIRAECVSEVLFEPLQHIDQTVGCTEQTAQMNVLYGLDLMDGFQNNAYKYFGFNAADDASVAAIVLDTDVDDQHVEFIDSDPESIFTGTPAPTTSQDHGTHVAGTVVGEFMGVAKNTKLYYYPVCQLGSSCGWSDIEGGYEAAIALMLSNPGTKFVINYSVGGGRTSSNEIAYEDWGQRIAAAGGFWATSAGNSRADACNFAPAFTSYAVTVGSYSSNREPTTWFTNYGVCVDTWAPGDSIYSSNPGGGYGYSSGTSMASPHICGLIINLLKDNPLLSLSDVKSKLDLDSQPLFNVPSTWAGNNRAAYWNSGCN